MTINVEFIITTCYCIPSCILYILLGYVIIKNRKDFAGSYYNIILIDSAVNVLTYLNSLITVRLPRATCLDCFLAPFLYKIPGMTLHFWMWNHLSFMQCLMVLSLIFNRFTAIVFPLQYTTIWDRLFIPLMLFNLIVPIVFTWKIFTVTTVTFIYYEPRDAYLLMSDPDMYPTINMSIIPTFIVISLIGAVFMVSTIVLYFKKSRATRDHHLEIGLMVFSMIYFLVQVFATIVMVAPHLATLWDMPFLDMTAQYLFPYAIDGYTFSSPYILLLCSRRLRTLLKQLVIGKVSHDHSVVTLTSRQVTLPKVS